MLKIKKKFSAFTLLELIVVMGILIVLGLMSFAGIQYALRKSRDTQRIQMVGNLEAALQAYYGDEQDYPSGTDFCGSTAAEDLCLTGSDMEDILGDDYLGTYLEGSWDWGPLGDSTKRDTIGYYVDSNGLNFGICILTEDKNGGELEGNDTYSGCLCKGQLGPSLQDEGCPGLAEGSPNTPTPEGGSGH